MAYWKPKLLDLIEHLDRGLKAELQVAVVHELADALLLEQAVDVRHVLGQVIVEDRAADRRVHVLLARNSTGSVCVTS